MIEIEDLKFGGNWLHLNGELDQYDERSYRYVYEQLFAMMMGWAD